VNRSAAYSLLATRLNQLRETGYDGLVRRVGQSASCETLHVNGEPVEIELAVAWADPKHRRLRVRGVAYGPSTWTIERFEEAFVTDPEPK
jgi:hypothetical protein